MDIATEKVTYTLEQIDRNHHIKGVTFSPDGKTIATKMGGKVQLWDIPTQTLKLTIPENWGLPLAFSPDGNTIVTGGDWNMTIQLWDTTTEHLKNDHGHAGPVKE